MATWSVRVELAPRDGVTADDVLDQLTDQMVDFGAAVALEDRGHLAVQLTIDAGTRRAAFDKGDKTVTQAATAVGLTAADVVEVQVLTWAEFEHRLGHPRIPELWGPTEAATYLGVKNPRIDQLVQEHPEELPVITKLAGEKGARIWLKSTWTRFASGWERSPGRPKMTAIRFATELEQAGCHIQWKKGTVEPHTAFNAQVDRGQEHRSVEVTFYPAGGFHFAADASGKQLANLAAVRRRLGVTNTSS